MAKWVYAVAKGHQTGVFMSWEECRAQVNGYTGAVFKKFTSPDEAQAFIDSHSSNQSSSSKAGKRLEIRKELEALKASNQAMRSSVVLLMDGLDENNARIDKLVQEISSLEGKEKLIRRLLESSLLSFRCRASFFKSLFCAF